MGFPVRCPNLSCRKILLVTEATRNQRVRCKYCRTLLRVPRQGETMGESYQENSPTEKKGKSSFFKKKNPANFS